jgi:hypothetical protein
MSNPRYKVQVNKAKLHAYIKNRLGYSTAHGVELYQLACEALAKDGFPLPAGSGTRSWVKRNLHVIYAFWAKIKKDESDEWVEAVTTKPQSTVSPNSDAFLKSYEWRKVRMLAIKQYGPRCMCCGASPSDGVTINVDHIKPRRLYPHLALDINNLQILCNPCNHGKGSWDMTDWRPKKAIA